MKSHFFTKSGVFNILYCLSQRLVAEEDDDDDDDEGTSKQSIKTLVGKLQVKAGVLCWNFGNHAAVMKSDRLPNS